MGDFRRASRRATPRLFNVSTDDDGSTEWSDRDGARLVLVTPSGVCMIRKTLHYDLSDIDLMIEALKRARVAAAIAKAKGGFPTE